MDHHLADGSSQNVALFPNQSSAHALTMDSEAENDAEQDPDMPLEHNEETHTVASQKAAEDYVPWWAGNVIGVLPRVLGAMCGVNVVLLGATAGVLYFMIFILACIDEESLQPLGKYAALMANGAASILNLAIGTINWIPVVLIYLYLSTAPSANKTAFWPAVAIGSVLFGVLCFVNWIISDAGLQAWYVRPKPEPSQGCMARVTPQQSSLFTPHIYASQFARVFDVNRTGINWFETYNATLARSIQQNQTLYSQGFDGNSDLYRLGIRTSIYLQWVSALCANNLLPEDRNELQKVYLIFSLAICIATIVSSFRTACIFGIETELLYLMYWGGYLYVFATSPCSVRLGSEIKWLGLDWISVLQFTTHMLMAYHGSWFVWYTYNQVYSRMPCGTHQFFLVRMLDPSQSFFVLRDVLTNLIYPLALPLLLVFPVLGILLASELKHSIRSAAIYQMFIPQTDRSGHAQSQNTAVNVSSQPSLALRVYLRIKTLYHRVRRFFALPSGGRRGIRLVTPLDITDRRYINPTRC